MIDIQKNPRETIRVRLREFRGQHYVDARVFFPGPDGELRPTAKGVTLSIDRAGDLARAIEQVAGQEAVDDGD